MSDIVRLQEKYSLLIEAIKGKKDLFELLDEIENLKEEIDIDFILEDFPMAIQQATDGVERVAALVSAMKEFSHPGSKEKENGDINKIIQTTVEIA